MQLAGLPSRRSRWAEDSGLPVGSASAWVQQAPEAGFAREKVSPAHSDAVPVLAPAPAPEPGRSRSEAPPVREPETQAALETYC